MKEAIVMIEQVLIKKTLKAGDNIWAEGSIENSPLPDVLLEEVRLNTGTVEVLKGSNNESPNKLVFVAKKVEENEVTTMTTQVKTESGAVLKSVPPPKQLDKPKSKLIRRKRK